MAEIEENKTGDGPSAKDTLREVLRDTISMAVGQGLSIQEFRGIALFNVERDEKITALGSFSDAIAKITDIPYFAERFGVEAATRVVLQFVYQYFKRADTAAYEERVFEGLYCDLVRELQVDFLAFSRRRKLEISCFGYLSGGLG